MEGRRKTRPHTTARRIDLPEYENSLLPISTYPNISAFTNVVRSSSAILPQMPWEHRFQRGDTVGIVVDQLHGTVVRVGIS